MTKIIVVQWYSRYVTVSFNGLVPPGEYGSIVNVRSSSLCAPVNVHFPTIHKTSVTGDMPKRLYFSILSQCTIGM